MHTSGASRRGVASACLMSTRAPHSQPSSPANGSAEWPPDDRLQRTIQYSEVPVMESKSCGVLDTPLSRSMTVSARSDATKLRGVRHRARIRNDGPDRVKIETTVAPHLIPIVRRLHKTPVPGRTDQDLVDADPWR